MSGPALLHPGLGPALCLWIPRGSRPPFLLLCEQPGGELFLYFTEEIPRELLCRWKGPAASWGQEQSHLLWRAAGEYEQKQPLGVGSFVHKTCVNHPLDKSLPSPWIANTFGITQRWNFVCFSKELSPWVRRRFTLGQSGAKMWLCWRTSASPAPISSSKVLQERQSQPEVTAMEREMSPVDGIASMSSEEKFVFTNTGVDLRTFLTSPRCAQCVWCGWLLFW